MTASGRSSVKTRLVCLVLLVFDICGVGSTGATFAVEPQPITFVLDSTSSTYPFSMRLEGVFEHDGEAIVVSVKSGEIRSGIPPGLGDGGTGKAVVIALGIGRVVTAGWQMTNDTEPQLVADELRPGESLPVTPHRFVVKGLEGVPLSDVWLVARLTVRQALPGFPAGPLSSYACAEPSLAGITPASRARAKAMAENYAHAC